VTACAPSCNGVVVTCELAQQYEELRRVRLQEGWGGRGLALLMGQGMVAWMEVVATDATSGERSVAASLDASPQRCIPIKIKEQDVGLFQAEAVRVLTSMAVGVLREVWA
jgi:hypothetical protein